MTEIDAECTLPGVATSTPTLADARAAYAAAQVELRTVAADGAVGPEFEAAARRVMAAATAVAQAQHREARSTAQVGTWRPPNAAHVLGTWEPRLFDPETGLPEPQRVMCICEWPDCGGVWTTECSSGLVREHVQRFALVHLHRDVFAPPVRATR